MRRILLALTLSLALLLAGAVPVMAQDHEQVEIINWWTAGGEEEALMALFDVFEDQYPDFDPVSSAVAGGAGTDAKAVMITRLVGGNPPDSFQVHGGAELFYSYVDPGFMEPVTDLMEDWGVKDAFNPEILDMVRGDDGEIYSVPLNVHRSNVMWYNKGMLEEHGLEAPETVDEMFEVFEALEQEDITPLALGDVNRWPTLHLFENLMLATMGPEDYNAVWDGEIGLDHEGVREALEMLDQAMDYINPDHAALEWQGAAELLIEEEAAFTVMGDWAEGFFRAQDWEPAEDYGWTTVPETEGNYMVITDTFGLPEGAPNPEGAEAWMRTVASQEGQDAFNPVKGSIPARMDAEEDRYSLYLQEAMEDFESDTLSPSIAHGSAAPEDMVADMEDILNEFVADRDIDHTFNRLQQSAMEHLQ
ncbi:ABC transporter substrate-binding protein [Halarsenatibacter silvermanii]|uniref:Probable sugar-binding periplasmic protein n=1 Tax=Halarsenatibacter silvermanii TaxID=321763 RepID=A0A1G9HET2_9FIRM|nr:ABC transporter substrate-binding protein [Halarsenatibacter silvermanii]SDL11214.1 carbohydrate ABC transporter substrate-binding protein, CUT1 family [Halarsenatibacter silvermanii]